MKRDYFAKSEQIYKGGRAMIIMDIKVDNIYAFKDFHINMSYPKKIVNSTIENFWKRGQIFGTKKLISLWVQMQQEKQLWVSC